MAWNEFSGCGRPARIEFDALLAKSATDAVMLEAVTAAILSAAPDTEALTRAAIAAVLKELKNVEFG